MNTRFLICYDFAEHGEESSLKEAKEYVVIGLVSVVFMVVIFAFWKLIRLLID